MKITKIDYSAIKEDVFYKHIYPIYPKEFLFGSNYENFAFLISANFVLNPQQWEYILEHWEQKETILSIEDTNKQTTEQEVKEIFLTAREKELIGTLRELVNIVEPHFTKMGVKKAFSELLRIEAAKKVIHKLTY